MQPQVPCHFVECILDDGGRRNYNFEVGTQDGSARGKNSDELQPIPSSGASDHTYAFGGSSPPVTNVRRQDARIIDRIILVMTQWDFTIALPSHTVFFNCIDNPSTTFTSIKFECLLLSLSPPVQARLSTQDINTISSQSTEIPSAIEHSIQLEMSKSTAAMQYHQSN